MAGDMRGWLVAISVGLGAGALGGACAAGGGASGSGGVTTGTGGGAFDGGTQSTGTGVDPDSACATASDEAKSVPVDMLIMFDKSGSMSGPKWSACTAALQSFFMDPASAGLRVALRFFPDDGCDEDCDVTACSHPKVPLGALTELSAPTDVQEQALLDAFLDVVPSGGTPMSAALDGAIEWATTVLATAPDDKAVVVLVTDGEPEDCNTSASYLIHTASQAYEEQGILTFAIGLQGSDEALMNSLASAGGTTKGIIIGATDPKKDLLAALEEISDTTVACEYAMPTSTTGQEVDPGKINVLYYPGDGSLPITVGQVAGADACGNKAAWYYDDPVKPTTIRLCPAACQGVQADPHAKLEILLGCGTIPA
jgi:hypothetical protein